jgi:phage-related protein
MKDIRFCGGSLEALRAFPAVAKRDAGYQLDRVQHGLDPSDWKPMPSIGPGVREIRIMHEGQFRVIYIAKLADAVYVLHAFQKKTQKTRKQDIGRAKHALKQL